MQQRGLIKNLAVKKLGHCTEEQLPFCLLPSFTPFPLRWSQVLRKQVTKDMLGLCGHNMKACFP